MKTSFTAHPSSDRERKNLLFLNLIERQKSTSRTDISKRTGVNIVSVSNYINTYLKKGLVVERGYDVSSGGRRPELVELNKKWGCVVGVDIGEDGVRGALANFGMEILASRSIQDAGKRNIKSLIDELLESLLASSRVDRVQIKKIGVAAAPDSVLEDIIKIKDSIEEETRISILTGNNALCAAFGEKALNPAATESSRILYLFTDLGRGVFIKDDEFYEAGDEESKFLYLRAWGQNLSIVNEAKQIVARGIGTKIVDIAEGQTKDITVDTVIKAAKERDETAVDLIRIAGMNLSVRIAYLINLLEPETVIIGGGIEKAGDIFLEPLTSNINKFTSEKLVNKARLVLASLGEEACAKGASSLARREVFIEV